MDPEHLTHLLSKMRELPPPAASWWPIAPGWWLLGGVTLLLLLTVFRARYRRRALRRAALQQLSLIRQAYLAGGECARLALQLNVLLRRVVLRRFSRADAALTGEAWLAFLDRHGGAGGFLGPVGRTLLTAPYAPHAGYDAGPLLGLVEHWLRENT